MSDTEVEKKEKTECKAETKLNSVIFKVIHTLIVSCLFDKITYKTSNKIEVIKVTLFQAMVNII